MLELRPTCENCNKALAANAVDAMICTYECTFCKNCVTTVLFNVCPNCGGGFCTRPVRPSHNLRNGNFLGNHPATTKITYSPVEPEAHKLFADEINKTPPNER